VPQIARLGAANPLFCEDFLPFNGTGQAVVTNWHHHASLDPRYRRTSTQRRRGFIDDAKHQTLMTTKTTIERGRITARVPQPVVDELEEAAALVGVTVNQFIVQAATERARAIIETHTRIDLSRRDAAFILHLLDRPAPANPALQRTGQRYKKAVVDEQDRLHPAAGRPRH